MPQLAIQSRSTSKFVTPLVLLIVSFLAFALTACSGGGAPSETVFTQSQNGVDMTITYYAVGDEVTKQGTLNVMSYEALGVSDANEAKKILDPIMAQFQGVTGVEHSVEYGATGVVEKMTVDYATADIAEVAKLGGSSYEGVTSGANKISLKKSIELIEKAGFTQVK